MADDVDAVAALADPVRRALYDVVVGADGPISRNDVAAASGVGRTLVAFHLDKLVELGLLVAGTRAPVKRGPGSGRPAKVYSRGRAVAVSVPRRDYLTIALLLAEVVGEEGRELVEAAALRLGRRSAGPDPRESLRERGYAPYDEGPDLRLRNCPFHVLAEEEPLLVCGVNAALCQGLVEGAGMTARLDPRPGECCVAISKNSNC